MENYGAFPEEAAVRLMNASDAQKLHPNCAAEEIISNCIHKRTGRIKRSPLLQSALVKYSFKALITAPRTHSPLLFSQH